MELGLRSRRVLVTGASEGIGLACAHAFAREGADVVIVSRRPAPLAEAAADIQSKHGVNVQICAADLSTDEGQRRVADASDDIDILINNAGSIPHGDLQSITDEIWRRAWNLKVFGYVNLCRLIMPKLEARGQGVVVNVIGAAAVRHRPGYIAGAAGNSALHAMTEALGSDSMRRGVRVVGVNPGLVATGRMEALLRAQAPERGLSPDDWRQLIPQDPPPAQPEDIADVVAFLASDRAGHVSGDVLTVDAGRHLR